MLALALTAEYDVNKARYLEGLEGLESEGRRGGGWAGVGVLSGRW
jgi:hypothetical protein